MNRNLLLAVLGFAPTVLACASSVSDDDTGTSTDALVLACSSSTPVVGAPSITWPPALTADYRMIAGTALGQRLSRGGLEYLAGNDLTIVVDTDACTGVRGVMLDSTALTLNGTSTAWYSLSTVALANGQVRTTVQIKLAARADGGTEALTLQFGPTAVKLGSVTATKSFTLVRVERVDAQLTPRPVGIGPAELHNKFAQGMWDRFNHEQNRTVVVDDDGESHTLYGYDPTSLSVTPTTSGTQFYFRFRSEETGCDPIIVGHGKFSVVAQPAFPLGVFWNASPIGDVIWPSSFCTVLANLFDVFTDVPNQTSLRSTLEAQILGALPSTGPAILYQAGSRTSGNGIEVDFKMPVPVVTIRVPYASLAEPRPTTAFPSGSRIALLGSGASRLDAHVSGPNGLPASAAYPAAKVAPRTASALPWSSRAVGSLLMREVPASISIPTTFGYEMGCAWSPVHPIAFGVNDTSVDAARNRANAASGYEVGVAFLDASLGLDATSCPVLSVTPPTK